ncbi:sigma54 specific transcriptional regulator, Fis family [Desulfovibrio sp. X2]|uniref:sigma-54 interaction domain-containing protein n=1 Tax=Desulfovibrio sp. X2 TaxID=941449 RepID=UPI00035895D9|nr:sigma 54-interacting transcriptional regulator [Desulfovibrio sp. X2]EPR38728.1 sigma54 specific transcriptional regulator, Fis family [Desulfovibrio sp. X2]
MSIDPNEFFRQAAVRICGSLDVEKALMDCLGYIKDYIPADYMDMCIFVPEANVLKPVAAASLCGEEKSDLIPVVAGEGQSPLAVWENMEEIFVVNRPREDPCVYKALQLMGKEDDDDFSLIVMRLDLQGRRIGALGVSVTGTDRFRPEHTEMLLLLREPFAIAMSNALKHQEVVRLKDLLDDDNRFLQTQIRELSGADIVGADFGLREVMTQIRQVAPLDSPVVLLGETGVGKEVLAAAIHEFSHRRRGPFIKVNCGAIPETLIDSELFGHEKGAFTGALARKRGRFERADGGTIFLDEIGELPPQAQVRLLHVVQRREIERVGGSEPIPVDIRIVAATHRNLERMVAEGRFREDLWFRLNIFPVWIPPLRERKEDIPALVHHFIQQKARELKLSGYPVLPPGALERLKAYAWPGNVRELENTVERAMIRSRDGVLVFDAVQGPRNGAGQDAAASEERFSSFDEVAAAHIRKALETAGGKVNGAGGAAELLGLHPNTLRKRMLRLGIPFGRGTAHSASSSTGPSGAA